MPRFASIIIMRVMFGGLLGFEAANYFRVFKFQIVYTWLGLILTALVVWAALEYLHHRSAKRLHVLAWVLVVAAVLVDFSGEMLRWYASIPYYDKVAHIFGGAAATAAILLYYQTKRTSLRAQEIFRAAVITAAAGYLYEFEEFAEDALTLSHRWGGLYDSAGDVLANVAGAMLVILLIHSRRFYPGAQSSSGHDTPTTQPGLK